ncbi:hypothetical protein PHYC_03771 [Phycisphaerales bacterium]|nr:hypothetical protein PHYC_03771 [Phycisphaerales bacterium]
MIEAQAEMLAKAVGGEAWQSGGDIWVVTRHTGGGLTGEPERYVVFSAEVVCEYESEKAFEDGAAPLKTISLGGEDERWVIQDDEGNVFFEDEDLELGWRDESEAERQARYLETREGGKYWVREQ